MVFRKFASLAAVKATAKTTSIFFKDVGRKKKVTTQKGGGHSEH